MTSHGTMVHSYNDFHNFSTLRYMFPKSIGISLLHSIYIHTVLQIKMWAWFHYFEMKRLNFVS